MRATTETEKAFTYITRNMNTKWYIIWERIFLQKKDKRIGITL